MDLSLNLLPSLSEPLLNLLPVLVLGFLGSFGHCAGMCGPLVVAFSLTDASHGKEGQGDSMEHRTRGEEIAASGVEIPTSQEYSDRHPPAPQRQPFQTDDRSPHWSFQLWLNLGRLLGYAIVGGLLGGIGEATIAGGQLAGVGSGLRQIVAIVTGLLLVWFGIMQVNPKALPPMPLLQPVTGGLHRQISAWMSGFAHTDPGSVLDRGKPILLGSLWGLMPCGFLFAAQLKAAGTGSAIAGLLTMLAFGVGTLPVMLGIGWSASWLSADRRGQLFRAAGVVAIAIGGITILRTDGMFDWSGHTSLFLLSWALAARPLARWWPTPLRYRRAIGVAAFILAIGHLGYQADHSLNWNLEAVRFMLPTHRYGLVAGIIAIACMTPAAVTSFDRFQIALGKTWRRLHLLTVPALICAVSHTLLSGSHYLGELSREASHYGRSGFVVAIALMVLMLRTGRLSRHTGPDPAAISLHFNQEDDPDTCCRDR
jgi:sulfite exporter TauE/SafE